MEPMRRARPGRSAVDGPPWVLGSAGGLRAVIVDGGAPASLGTDRIELVQHAASAFAPGLLQLWLRDRATGRAWPMLGAGIRLRPPVSEDGDLVVTGRADGGLEVAADPQPRPRPHRLVLARRGAQRRTGAT